jgi:hypothetical protein
VGIFNEGIRSRDIFIGGVGTWIDQIIDSAERLRDDGYSCLGCALLGSSWRPPFAPNLVPIPSPSRDLSFLKTRSP